MAEDAPALVYASAGGRIANVTIRCTGDGEAVAVEVRTGQPEIEDCAIESTGTGILASNRASHGSRQSHPCRRRERHRDRRGRHRDLRTQRDRGRRRAGHRDLTSASPVIRANRIHRSHDAAILVMGGGGEPLLEETTSSKARARDSTSRTAPPRSSATIASTRVKTPASSSPGAAQASSRRTRSTAMPPPAWRSIGSPPVIPRNRIGGGADVGVYVHDEGEGTIEDNDIFENESAGVWISTGADPILRRNPIHHHPQAGVIVRDGGSGLLEENDVWANRGPGVPRPGPGRSGAPSQPNQGRRARWGLHRRCRRRRARRQRHLRQPGRRGRDPRTGADPTLRGNQLHDGVDVGVLVPRRRGRDRGGEQDLRQRSWPASRSTGALLSSGRTRSATTRGPESSLPTAVGGSFEANAIHGNAGAGVMISAEGDPTRRPQSRLRGPRCRRVGRGPRARTI